MTHLRHLEDYLGLDRSFNINWLDINDRVYPYFARTVIESNSPPCWNRKPTRWRMRICSSGLGVGVPGPAVADGVPHPGVPAGVPAAVVAEGVRGGEVPGGVERAMVGEGVRTSHVGRGVRVFVGRRVGRMRGVGVFVGSGVNVGSTVGDATRVGEGPAVGVGRGGKTLATTRRPASPRGR